MPTKSSTPVTSKNPTANAAALSAALASPNLAAKKLAFQQQMAKLESDSSVQTLRVNIQQLFTSIVNGTDMQQRRSEMSSRIAAAKNSSSYQNQKARFLNGLQCTPK